jgi:hypothetical protein
MVTADLRVLYPCETEDQAVLRSLTRNRSASSYERVRLAADALKVRARAVRRTDCYHQPERLADAVITLRSAGYAMLSEWERRAPGPR